MPLQHPFSHDLIVFVQVLGRLKSVDYDGVSAANFNTGFAAEAFFGVHGNGFFILHFKNAHGTNVNTLFATNTLVRINNGIIIRHAFFSFRK